MSDPNSTFAQFVKERTYLKNVTPRTIDWYKQSWKWLSRFPLTEEGLKRFVIELREARLKPISCNSRIRFANAYLSWLGSPLRVPKLKVEKRILPTYTPEQLKLLIDFHPQNFYDKRLHTLILTEIDTGVRITELLSLTREKINLNGLYFTVFGKGQIERLVAFSFVLRKHLLKWLNEHQHDIVFPTSDGGMLGRRDVLRDVKRLSKKLGFTAPARSVHALRHTFSINYLRQGGSVFHLQRALGHSSLEMSRNYANLMNDDLLETQQKVSFLNKAKR